MNFKISNSLLIVELITFCSILLSWYATAKPAMRTLASSENTHWEHVNKTCLSSDCDEHVNIKHLQYLAIHMSRSVNPCEDFHAYACSYWKKQYPKEQNMMAVAGKQLTEKFQQIFAHHREKDKLKKGIIMQKLNKYYEVCLTSEQKEKASWKKYVLTLREMGYLQFAHNTSWMQTLRDLTVFSNSHYFISLHLERYNATLFTLYIDPHNVGEKVKFSLDIYELLKLYTNVTFPQLELEFKNLELDLENILKSSCANENTECDLTEMLTYQELLMRNSSTNWKFLLSHFPLEYNDSIYIDDIITIDKIKNYLDHCNQEILFLYSVSRFINYLQSHTHNIVDKGSSAQSCLRHMHKHFPLLMNYVYEQEFYAENRPESDRVINHVFAELKQQFSLILDANQMQFSSESLQYLQRKLRYLELNIGNLPKNASHFFYEEFISDLNVTDNFFVNNLMSLKHFYQRQRKLASPSKFSPMWFTFSLHMPDFSDNLDSTAYFFSIANFIILPYAYLQLPFYDHRFWPSLLFGDLANTLGHELIHPFDTKFIMYNYGGEYSDNEAANILNNTLFQQNVACLKKDPTDFLSERIADISGTRLALKTFVTDPQFLKHNGKLFFLQFAQFFCGSTTKESFALVDSSHDLDSLRLNYTLAHTPEFAEVFQCPLGSPMNPIDKCELW